MNFLTIFLFFKGRKRKMISKSFSGRLLRHTDSSFLGWLNTLCDGQGLENDREKISCRIFSVVCCGSVVFTRMSSIKNLLIWVIHSVGWGWRLPKWVSKSSKMKAFQDWF